MNKIKVLLCFSCIFMLCGFTNIDNDINTLSSSHKIEITLDADGGNCEKNNIIFFYEGDIAPSVGVLPVCTKDNYTFIGWKDSNGNTVTETTPVTDISENYLKAYYTLSNKTITLNANGGSCTTSVINVVYGNTVGTLPIPEYSGYTFDGWFTQESGGVQITSDTQYNYKTSITVYAHWIINKSLDSADSNNISASSKKNNAKIKISWKKVTGATGYQLKYSTSKKFTKKTTKTKNVGKSKKSITISNLVKGKKYYVKMRAYKKRKGKSTIYSSWSKVINKKAK